MAIYHIEEATVYQYTGICSGSTHYSILEPDWSDREEYSIREIPLSEVPVWELKAILADLEDVRAFEAPFLGCEEATTVHVAGSHNEDGVLHMEIITPTGHAFITKEQAMQFFGLIEA